jgi:hypothetical protein
MANFQREQQDLRDALLAEMKPKGPVEMSVFDQLARSAWMLQRLREVDLHAADPVALQTLEKLEKVRAHHRKMYDQSLAWLRRLQTERAMKNPRDLISAREEAPLADPQRIERAIRKQQRGRARRTAPPLVDLAKLPPATDLIQ